MTSKLVLAAILATAAHPAASQVEACRADLAACLVGGPQAAADTGVWRHIFRTSPYGGVLPLETCLSFDLAFTVVGLDTGRLEAVDPRTDGRCEFAWSTAPEGAFRFSISREDETALLSARLHPDEEFVARFCNGLPATALALTRRAPDPIGTRTFCYSWDAGG